MNMKKIALAILKEMQRSDAVSLRKIRVRYEEHQLSRVVPRHLQCVLHHIDVILRQSGARKVSDLTPRRVDEALDWLARKGLSGKTQNEYLSAIRAMTAWAVREQMVRSNPLAGMRKRIAIQVRPRRPLTLEEVERLIKAAVPAAIYRAVNSVGVPSSLPMQFLKTARIKGERNAMIYKISVYTGLRQGELRALKWEDVDLRARVLRLRVEHTKKGRITKQAGETEIPLHSALVRDLFAWRATCGIPPPDVKVVEVPCSIHEIFQSDLRYAGIEREDNRGRVADFHSLRHTFATWLREHVKTDPKIYQLLMRHSALATTLAYQHAREEELRQAVEALPTVDRKFGGEHQEIFWTDEMNF